MHNYSQVSICAVNVPGRALSIIQNNVQNLSKPTYGASYLRNRSSEIVNAPKTQELEVKWTAWRCPLFGMMMESKHEENKWWSRGVGGEE